MKFKVGDRVVLKQVALEREWTGKAVHGTVIEPKARDRIFVEHNNCIRVCYDGGSDSDLWWAGWWRKERKGDAIQAW